MSIYFVSENEQDIWNPSNIVGHLFCDQAKSLARLMDAQTGLGPVISDQVEISDLEFKLFVGSFATFILQTSAGSTARLLLDGCFSISGALAEKLGASAPEDPELARLVARGRAIVG